jgi:hypothetical protein
VRQPPLGHQIPQIRESADRAATAGAGGWAVKVPWDAKLFRWPSVSPPVGRPPPRPASRESSGVPCGRAERQGVVARSPGAVTQRWVAHRAGLGSGFPRLVGSVSCLHVTKARRQATWAEVGMSRSQTAGKPAYGWCEAIPEHGCSPGFIDSRATEDGQIVESRKK